MRALDFLGNVLDSILRVVIIVFVVYTIYKGIAVSYDYGYRVFNETPVAVGMGRDISVTIPVDMSAKDMGELLEEKGLIRDGRLFILQYYASEYREDLKHGTYTLNTAMTVEEMLELMTGVTKDEADAAEDNASKGK